MVQAQEWLDENYPKEIRKELKRLEIKNKNLESGLNLRDFTNLRVLDCSENKLTDLEFSGLTELRELCCNNNYLTTLDYSSLDPSKLTHLDVTDNNLKEENLSIFVSFINLRRLLIGNEEEEKFRQGIYNRFYGSLESLKFMNKLDSLHISNTDINSGVEHIPSSVERISYFTERWSKSKVKEISEHLSCFLNNKKNDKSWKKIHSDFNKKIKEEWEILGFSYQQAEKWIKVGLQPNDYSFATWLRWKDYQPQESLNLEALRKTSKSAQKWLDETYPLKKRKKATSLDISGSGLEEKLIIKNFPKLERIDCSHNQLTILVLRDLPELSYLNAYRNKLTELIIDNCSELINLNLASNFLTNLNFLNSLDHDKLYWLDIADNIFYEDVSIFSKFKHLEHLLLTNNHFYGNLKSLRSLSNLESLSVASTEVNEGFEYLSNNLRHVASISSQNLKKSTDNFKLIGWTEMKKGRGLASENYIVPHYDFRHWKESKPLFQWLKKELEKIYPKLTVNEYLLMKGIRFFNVLDGSYEGKNIGTIIDFDKKIVTLRDIIAEISGLQEVIKKQKELINKKIQSYPNQKELLEEFVKVYTETEKLKNKKIYKEDELDEMCEKWGSISDKLIGNKVKGIRRFIEEIKKNCEELAKLETDIVEFQKEIRNNITIMINNGSINVAKGNAIFNSIFNEKVTVNAQKQITNTNYGLSEEQFKELMERLTGIEQTIEKINQAIEERSEKQIAGLSVNQALTEKEKEIIKKAINLLDSKKIFLNLRQGTIDSLQACCDKFEQAHTTGKYAIIDDVSDIITSVGEIADPLIETTGVPVSPVTATGRIISGVNSLFKKKSITNNSKKIQEVLVTDKKSILLFDEYYTSLINAIWNNEEDKVSKIIIEIFDLKKNKTSLFSEHDVFHILNIWESKLVITLDEMKDSIEKLKNGKEKFKEKLEDEENQFQQRIFTKFTEINNQQLQTQIQIPPK